MTREWFDSIVWWWNWNAIAAVTSSVLVVVAICGLRYAKRQLEAISQQIKDFRAESRVQHLNDLEKQFRTEPLATSRKEFAEERLKDDKPMGTDNPPFQLRDLLNFFEHVGYLMHGDYLNLEDVYVEFHFYILNICEDAKELIDQENLESPIYYKYLKAMRDLLWERRKRDGGMKFFFKAFYEEESRLPVGNPIPRGLISSRVRGSSQLKGQLQGYSRFGWENAPVKVEIAGSGVGPLEFDPDK